MVVLTFLLCELMQETGLAHPHVTYDDVFEDIRVVVRSSSHRSTLDTNDHQRNAVAGLNVGFTSVDTVKKQLDLPLSLSIKIIKT